MRIGSIVNHVGAQYVVTDIRDTERVQVSVLTNGVIGRDEGNHPRRWFQDTGQLYTGPNAPVPIQNYECYLILYLDPGRANAGIVRRMVRGDVASADRWIRDNNDVTIVKRTKVTIPYTLPVAPEQVNEIGEAF